MANTDKLVVAKVRAAGYYPLYKKFYGKYMM